MPKEFDQDGLHWEDRRNSGVWSTFLTPGRRGSLWCYIHNLSGNWSYSVWSNDKFVEGAGQPSWGFTDAVSAGAAAIKRWV